MSLNSEVSLNQINVKETDEYFRLNTIAPRRYSLLFLTEILSLKYLRVVEPCSIIREVEFLEGFLLRSCTKAPKPLTKDPLKGLYHKHYFAPAFLAKNIGLHWRDEKKIQQVVEECLVDGSAEIITHQMINNLVQKIVNDGFQERMTNEILTGEWIVYAVHEGKNYYLCCANHTDKDQDTYDKIKQWCENDFLFLKSLLKF